MGQQVAKKDGPPYGIIAVLMIGAFITFLNNTFLNIALSSIMVDLNVDTATVQWLTTGFMLVNGILIPTTAYLIQKYSVRRLFIVAMGLFSIGTIIGGFAHYFSLLLIARMVQASGSAIMMPLLMNVMLVSFPVAKRGAAMGIFGLILMFAPAIGPTLSGWIIEHYDWRMLFHFITPIAIVVLLLGAFMLRDKKDKVDLKLDVLSVILSSLGFGGLLFGFSTAGRKGWSDSSVYISLIVGTVTLTLFIVRQLRMERPLLNFSVFRYPMFALASAITMIVNMAMFSGFLLLPIYTQIILGFSPMDAGLMLLPGAIINAAMSPITGRLFDRFGGRILAATGLLITAATTYMMSNFSMQTTYEEIMILHAVRMFGMSMVLMPVSTNGLNQLPRSLYPHGTAMNNTLNQVSGAIGTALLITVMSNRQSHYQAQYLSDAIQNAGGEPAADTLMQIVLQSMLDGINDAFFVATILTLVAFVMVLFIKRAVPADDPAAMPAVGKKGKLLKEM